MTERKKKEYRIPLVAALIVLLIACVFSIEALTAAGAHYRLPFVGFGGTFRYPDVTLGGMRFSLYWSFFIIGIMGMCIISYVRREEIGISPLKSLLTGVLIAIFGFIGAKLLYIIEDFRSVLANGIGFAGISFFGTVFFMPAVIPLISRILGIRKKGFMDFCAPAGVLMLAILRLGCFTRGCCGGILVMVGLRPWIPPVQLVECALDLMLLGMLLHPAVKQRFRGVLYALLMGAYGVIRFLLEFLRDTPKRILGMSNGQIFSLIAVAAAAAVLILYFRKKRAPRS
ncbi:MAG: prolipoprotein diacylglyceryl transferase [Lachnospiraceae bacterium]|nr:prolipoprotein diacylglyceryl transferase [Lachnospiraceae bacterium]